MTATLPLASFVGNGGAVTAAIVGGSRNFRISVTTSPRCLLSASSLPFRRKAFHRACLSGASLNSSVNARGASASKGVERWAWKEQTTRVVTSKRGSIKESALTLTPSRKRAPRRFSARRIRFLGQVEQTPKMRSTSNTTSEPRRTNLLCPDWAPNHVWAALRRFLN